MNVAAVDVRERAVRGGQGALAGVVATVPMSLWMAGVEAVAGRRAHGEQPPRRMTRAAAEAVGFPAERHPRATDAASLAAHLGFGAFLGLVLAELDRRPNAWHGLVFGGAVYATAYAGVVPALGILPPPDEDKGARQWSVGVGHVWFGITLGAVLGRLFRRTGGHEDRIST